MRDKRLLQIIILFSAFALFISLSISLGMSMLGLDDNGSTISERISSNNTTSLTTIASGSNSNSNGTATYEGNECAYQEVIIVYEDNQAAQESVEVIESEEKSVPDNQFELHDDTPLADDENDGSQDASNTDDSSDEPKKENDADTDDEKSGDDDDDDDKDEKDKDEKSDLEGSKKQEESEDIIKKAEVKEKDKNVVVVKVEDDVDLVDYIEEIENQPGVKYAQPNYAYKLDDVNSSIEYFNANEASLNTVRNVWHLYTIQAFDAWGAMEGYGDSSILIGVIDSGVDIDHPDLVGNLAGHYAVPGCGVDGDDQEGHGTKVSGLIAGAVNTVSGTSGVAPGSSLYVIDATRDDGLLYTTDIVTAIDKLMIENVDIINMSFGTTTVDPTLETKIEAAYAAGITLVAAAGNDGTDAATYPSDYSEVISVMSSNINDDFLSINTNYGAAKDITAPGELMKTTTMGGIHSYVNGTSYAAPIVSGTVALMLSVSPNISNERIVEFLSTTTDSTCKSRIDSVAEYGWGRINTFGAVDTVLKSVGIDVLPEETLLQYGETEQLVVTIRPDDAVAVGETYLSSDELIATVDENGLITAQNSSGEVEITVTYVDAVTAEVFINSCTVTVVEQKVESVDILEDNLHIGFDDPTPLTATIYPVGATNQNMSFISSDTSVATVDVNGVVTGHDFGEVSITVITEESEFFDVCNIQVGFHITSMTIDGGQMPIGEIFTITPVIEPANASNKNIFYTSSDPDIASVVGDGEILGLALGTVTITAVTEDGGIMDTCIISSGYHAESVAVTPKTLQIEVDGPPGDINATVSPSNASLKTVIYSSSDESIATVDAAGTVRGIAPGVVTITATTEDGGHTDTSEVTVIQRVTGVTLLPESFGIVPLQTFALDASTIPENASNQGVTYTSSNEAVATVDSAGVVTAHQIGDATITVTTDDGGFTDTCDVYVVEDLITSSVYNVNRTDMLFENLAIGATVQEVLDSIDVKAGMHIYNTELVEVTGDDLVSTGYYIRLLVGETAVDEVRILIEGDCNPDTVLDIIDYTMIRLHIFGVSELTGLALDAADVNDDGVIDIIDYTLIRLHIFNVSSLY